MQEDAIQTDLTEEQREAARILLRLFASPMESAMAIWERGGAPLISVDATGLDQFESPWSSSSWSLMLAYAMTGVLEEPVFDRMMNELSKPRRNGDDPHGAYLVAAARIAAAQGNATFAQAVAESCIEAVEQASEPGKLGAPFHAAGIAAAAIGSDWVPWLGRVARVTSRTCSFHLADHKPCNWPRYKITISRCQGPSSTRAMPSHA